LPVVAPRAVIETFTAERPKWGRLLTDRFRLRIGESRRPADKPTAPKQPTIPAIQERLAEDDGLAYTLTGELQ